MNADNDITAAVTTFGIPDPGAPSGAFAALQRHPPTSPTAANPPAAVGDFVRSAPEPPAGAERTTTP